eukprot:TRINITY_DN5381_c0_g1_i1.p1 TRINITY_DN5381_c0_g1~~TRINITY_DN5381_c0_g1_i1.p1  ORF type:complete len:405 (+),score=48.21 TRINITY_DN5381_c0_g1_i1:119-1333(+)
MVVVNRLDFLRAQVQTGVSLRLTIAYYPGRMKVRFVLNKQSGLACPAFVLSTISSLQLLAMSTVCWDHGHKHSTNVSTIDLYFKIDGAADSGFKIPPGLDERLKGYGALGRQGPEEHEGSVYLQGYEGHRAPEGFKGADGSQHPGTVEVPYEQTPHPDLQGPFRSLDGDGAEGCEASDGARGSGCRRGPKARQEAFELAGEASEASHCREETGRAFWHKELVDQAMGQVQKLVLKTYSFVRTREVDEPDSERRHGSHAGRGVVDFAGDAFDDSHCSEPEHWTESDFDTDSDTECLARFEKDWRRASEAMATHEGVQGSAEVRGHAESQGSEALRDFCPEQQDYIAGMQAQLQQQFQHQLEQARLQMQQQMQQQMQTQLQALQPGGNGAAASAGAAAAQLGPIAG